MIFAMLNSFADLLWALQVVLLIVFVFSLIFLNVPGLKVYNVLKWMSKAVAAHFDSVDATRSVALV